MKYIIPLASLLFLVPVSALAAAPDCSNPDAVRARGKAAVAAQEQAAQVILKHAGDFVRMSSTLDRAWGKYLEAADDAQQALMLVGYCMAANPEGMKAASDAAAHRTFGGW